MKVKLGDPQQHNSHLIDSLDLCHFLWPDLEPVCVLWCRCLDLWCFSCNDRLLQQTDNKLATISGRNLCQHCNSHTRTQNTFCGTWYLPHSYVHNERTVPIFMTGCMAHEREGYITTSGLKSDVTLVLLDPDSFKMRKFRRFGHELALYCVIFIAHAQNSRIFTSGLKSDDIAMGQIMMVMMIHFCYKIMSPHMHQLYGELCGWACSAVGLYV